MEEQRRGASAENAKLKEEAEVESEGDGRQKYEEHKMDRQRSEEEVNRQLPHRRSAVLNLFDFLEKYGLSRGMMKRRGVLDLGESVNAADIARMERAIELQNANPFLDVVVRILAATKYLIVFVLWIFIGSMFYALHDDMGWYLGTYQSLSIGFSLGWELPSFAEVHHDMALHRIISKVFTLLHNIIGVLFSGLAVLYIAHDFLDRKNNWILQSDIKKKVIKKTSSNWVRGNMTACVIYNLPKFRVFTVFAVVAVAGTLWSFFAFRHTPDWTLPTSCALSFSTLSSAGYSTIPDSAERYQYLICAMFAACGVPLMTISLGLIIGRIFFDHEEVTLFEKMAEDISSSEIETMRVFCNKQKESQIDNLEFAILIALRIGATSPEMINQIKERFDILDRNHEGRLAYENILLDGSNADGVVHIARTNSFLKSSFNFRQLIALKAKSSAFNNKVDVVRDDDDDDIMRSDVSWNRGLSFESDGVPLTRLRSYSGCECDAVRTRLRTSSGCEEIFNAWVKESPDADNDHDSSELTAKNTLLRHQLSNVESVDANASIKSHRERSISIGAQYQGRKSGFGRQSSGEDYNYPESPRRSCRKRAISVGEDAAQNPSRGSFRSSFVSGGVAGWCKTPRHSMRTSFTLSEDEAMELAKRESEIVWIKGTSSIQCQDGETLKPDDFRRMDNDSPDHSKNNIIAHRRSGRRPSVAFPLVAPEPSENTDNENDIEKGRASSSLKNRGSAIQRISHAQSQRLSILDVARGRTSLLQFIEGRANSRRLGFHERSEQINIAKMEKARLHHIRQHSSVNGVKEATWLYLSTILFDPHVQFLLLWLAWLICGAIIFMVTYKTRGDENYILKGFYETVNVGYGLYLTVPEFKESGYTFTTFHLMIGSVMISGAMAEFARYLNRLNDSDNVRAVQLSQNPADTPISEVEIWSRWSKIYRIWKFVRDCWKKYPLHVLFIAWLVVTSLYVSIVFSWTFFDSVFFVVSVFSTGGFVSLPINTPTTHYFAVALFATIGVPLMALSLGMFTHYISRLGEQSAMIRTINAGISTHELSEMEELEIIDGDGYFDLSEYIILILLRTGALKPELIALTNVRFEQLQELEKENAKTKFMSGQKCVDFDHGTMLQDSEKVCDTRGASTSSTVN